MPYTRKEQNKTDTVAWRKWVDKAGKGNALGCHSDIGTMCKTSLTNPSRGERCKFHYYMRQLTSSNAGGCAIQESLNQIPKLLFYAPGNEEGLSIMTNIIQEQLNLKIIEHSVGNCDKSYSGGWILLPMISRNLQSSNLGDLLEHALERARDITNGSVAFLGMDSPVIPLDDVVRGLEDDSGAVLCPADDGGYGMLCVPPNAPSDRIFRNMIWSQSLTGMAQLKSLTDQDIQVVIGSLMYDIDETEDVKKLCSRLREDTTSSKTTSSSEQEGEMVLYRCSRGTAGQIFSRHPLCHFTRKALLECGLLE